MIPPVFTILYADTAVKALLGTSPLRVYPDIAPQNTNTPYAVYTVYNGAPQNTLDEAADTDIISTQIDVWAETPSSCESVAEAIRSAIEPSAYITSFSSYPPDNDTPLYRHRMDFDFFKDR